jgi:hypothetical protein
MFLVHLRGCLIMNFMLMGREVAKVRSRTVLGGNGLIRDGYIDEATRRRRLHWDLCLYWYCTRREGLRYWPRGKLNEGCITLKG